MKTMEEIKKLCLSRRNLSVLGVQVGIYALLVSIWSLVIMLLEHDVS
ncbi:MAG: histidine kinase, partial [Prevotella denticola]